MKAKTKYPKHPLAEKIRSRKACIAVVGLGYVGLPLALDFVDAGFKVMGLEKDSVRAGLVREGKSYIADISSERLQKAVKSKAFEVDSRTGILAKADCMIICVPTPLTKTGEPDITFILNAVEDIEGILRPGQLVILQSTTYPGTTREVLLPVLRRSGLKVGKDFFLSFCPERVDPGSNQYPAHSIPKVVSGITPQCRALAGELLNTVFDKIVPVSTCEVAEMSKLLENTFRSVNIGLSNEISMLCNHTGVNVWEVIEAAKTKPFGFMPFYPGPGLGGHCIGIDPMYLSWRARQSGFRTRFIHLADEINSNMPNYVVERITAQLNEKGKTLLGARILIIGVAYKRNVNDVRESPALDIMTNLIRKGVNVSYHDPYVPSLEVMEKKFVSRTLTRNELKKSDCAVIVTDHTNVDYQLIVSNSKAVLDTRNATAQCRQVNGTVKRL